MLAILESTLKCLERCTSLKILKQAHAQVFLNGFHRENYVAVKLVSICSKTLGCIGYARLIFDSLQNSANVFLWTTMITSYSNHQSEDTKEAILIYRMMHQLGPKPNKFTLSSVLKACSFLKAIREGNQIHAHSCKLGLGSSVYVQTTLLDMYAKFGWIQQAEQLFSDMSERSVVSCNAMIACYAKGGYIAAAQEVFDKMSKRDSVSWTIMISGYADHGNMTASRELFEQMPEREMNSWNALLAGYSHTGEWYEVVELFNDMRLEHVKPNHVTMAILISACSQIGVLQIARQIHGFLGKNCIEMNCYVCNSLVDMYAKCGSVHEAYRVFSEMPIKDVVSYNAMIAGFANHGCGEDALKLLPEMVKGGIQPDTVTFLGILTACSHSGLTDIGRQYFDCLSRDYAVELSVDHYACMIDLYGRAGFIEEAYSLVKTMAVEPHAGVWGALLNACRKHCHIEVGELAARELFKIEPGNPGNYVLLSNLYARAHLWDGVAEIRRFMRGRGVSKTAGWSRIEVNYRVHEFLTADLTPPQCKEICEVLRHLCLQKL